MRSDLRGQPACIAKMADDFADQRRLPHMLCLAANDDQRHEAATLFLCGRDALAWPTPSNIPSVDALAFPKRRFPSRVTPCRSGRRFARPELFRLRLRHARL